MSQSMKRVTEPKPRAGRRETVSWNTSQGNAGTTRARAPSNPRAVGVACGMRSSIGALRLPWLVRYSCSSSSAVFLSLGSSLDITLCYLAAGRLDALTPNAPRVDYAGTDPPRAGGAAVLGAGRRRGFVVPRAGGVEVWRLRQAQPFTSSTRVCAFTTWFSMQAIPRRTWMPCRVQRACTVPCRACRMDGRYHRRA